MFKRIMFLALGLIITVSLSTTCLADGTGNKRKGKYTYRKVYKACHARGEVESSRPLLNPDTKTQAQWQRTFKRKDFEQFKCQEEFQNLSDKDLLDILAYLHAHAADSPTPAKCK